MATKVSSRYHTLLSIPGGRTRLRRFPFSVSHKAIDIDAAFRKGGVVFGDIQGMEMSRAIASFRPVRRCLELDPREVPESMEVSLHLPMKLTGDLNYPIQPTIIAGPVLPQTPARETVLSAPGGRVRRRRLAERGSPFPPPSPIKRSTSTPSIGRRPQDLLKDGEDEDHEEEETLQLQVQEIQARLKLKRPQEIESFRFGKRKYQDGTNT
ncbi:uncharacterized protein PAC_00937 [Phialocephala subalpina]|uniref:Uncharacterized protein n=1 Tax=Phialocephala subalpina TaxID=576137 RepID=A0A1L7WE52_9HELO|nr:uncharacterized protein PAC_00937 [Phialocephala subalpina]